jgi:hypothetical protein
MRRRQAYNPYQIGDQVVIRKGMLSGLAGQVISRDDAGRVLIAIEYESARFLISVPYRNVERRAQENQPDSWPE